MGLDMYLNAVQYISRHTEPEQHKLLSDNFGKSEGLFTITRSVGYWRKANAIHRWFVENVQEGEDDCGEYPVTDSALTVLRDLCTRLKKELVTQEGQVHTGTTCNDKGIIKHIKSGKVVVNTELAEELLPCQPGFFFGNTDYDEGYLDDLDSTIEICNAALEASAKGADITYRSSW